MSRCTSATSRQAVSSTLPKVESGVGAGLDLFVGSFRDAHHLGQGNLFGRLGKLISARGAARAVDQPGPFELQQDLHQEPRGNAVLFGDFSDPHRLARLVIRRQLEHGDAGVFGLGGNSHGAVRSLWQSRLKRPHPGARDTSPRRCLRKKRRTATHGPSVRCAARTRRCALKREQPARCLPVRCPGSPRLVAGVQAALLLGRFRSSGPPARLRRTSPPACTASSRCWCTLGRAADCKGCSAR